MFMFSVLLFLFIYLLLLFFYMLIVEINRSAEFSRPNT